MTYSLYFIASAVLGVLAGLLIHHRLIIEKLFLYGHAFDEVHQLGYYVDQNGHLKPPLRGLPIFGRYADEAIAGLMTLKELGYEWHGGELWVPPVGKIPTFLPEDSVLWKGQADAWLKVYETLHEVKPDMNDMIGTGCQVACHAIRELALQAAEATRFRQALATLEYMTGKS